MIGLATLRMKLTLFSFDAPDESLDPFKHEFIGYARRDLTVVVDLRIEFFALLAHGLFPLTVKQRASIECVPPWRAESRELPTAGLAYDRRIRVGTGWSTFEHRRSPAPQ
ncbi:hypothetical protein Q3C01_35530 [Bradyrhizobium sp. UFLA05-109]